MATMTDAICERKSCRKKFKVRVADRNRGWGRFCSKVCAAVAKAMTSEPVGQPGDEYAWNDWSDSDYHSKD